jgi:flagellar assembly protein FliH
MTELDAIRMPEESLKNLRRWNPDALTARATGTERRAANQQPGREGAQGRAPAPEPAPAPPPQPDPLVFRQLHEEASRQGYIEGKALAEREIARMNAVVEDLQQWVRQAEAQCADDLLRLALGIARQVVRTELTLNPDATLTLVREVIDAAPESPGRRSLHLHPADAERVIEAMGSALDAGTWQVVPDASISPGGCRLASKICDIDATLATRWQQAMQTIGRNDAWQEPTA